MREMVESGMPVFSARRVRELPSFCEISKRQMAY